MMKDIHPHAFRTSPSYGTNLCHVCCLAVAEYLNGRLYLLSSGDMRYIHDGCYHHAPPWIHFPSGKKEIRPPPSIQPSATPSSDIQTK